MGFRTPEWFWLATLAIPLVLFYLLKVRRLEQRVSSVMLWRKALHELEAQVPLRRLRRDWLLLLQLLALAALVLAAAGPFVRGWLTRGERNAVVLDASAGMLADGRAEEARRRVRAIVQELGPGDELTLIRAGTRPEVLTSLTGDPTEIRRAVDRWQPSPAPADLASALVLARSLIGDEASIVLVTDGATPVPEFDGVRAVRMGSDAFNVGIVSLGVRPTNPSGREHDVFVRLRNASPVEAQGNLRLKIDGSVRDATRVIIDAEGEAERTLRLIDVESGVVEVSWSADRDDALTADDLAWWVLRPRSQRRYRVIGDAGAYFAHALGSLESWRPAEPGSAADLEIVVRGIPEADGPPFLWIDPPEMNNGVVDGGAVLTWERTHPVLRFVNLHPVRLGRVPRLVRPPGYRVLAESTAGPFLLEGERRGRHCVVWGFDPSATSLPLNVGFPLLVHNTLEFLVPEEGPVPGGVASSASLELSWPGGAEAWIVAPSGRRSRVAGVGGKLDLPPVDELGVWRLEEAAGTEDRVIAFGVSLLDAGEVDLRPRFRGDPLEPPVRNDRKLAEAGRDVAGLRDLAPLVLFGVLALLVFEALAFHRGWSP